MGERQEEKPVPPPTLLDLFQSFFHRQDRLLGYMAETQRQILALLRVISGAPPVTPPVTVPPVEVKISELNLDQLAEKITAKLVKLPNRLDRVEIDTSNTERVSLRKAGKLTPPVVLGFWVEDIGGGFDYRILREGKGPTKWRTAEADDKWDQEFDDLLVKGSGTSGTAVIYCWWRE